MSEAIELREGVEATSKSSDTAFVHEVESLPRRLHVPGNALQPVVPSTAEMSQEDRQTSKKQATTSRGFIGGALINVPLSNKLGFGKVGLCPPAIAPIQDDLPPNIDSVFKAMDESELDQETEAWMRPKINEGNISAESLEREILNSTSGLPPNFLSILGFLLTHTDSVHEILPEKYGYILVFVGSKDTGLNALFLDGVRHGKWSPVFSHPLLTTKWRVPSLFARNDDLPIPLYDVVRAAHREIVAKFEKYRLGGNPSESMKRPAPLWLSVSFVRHGESQSNAGNSQIMDPRLTSRGRYQASEVGQHRQWSDVRIDKLYLSNTTRTRETTECILENLGAEHKALLMAGRSDEAHSLRTGGGYAVSPTSVRRRHRTPGGESQEDVARRAQLALLHLIFDHGVQLASPQNRHPMIPPAGTAP
ncbi:hypothetical protein EYR36_009891 [Pleurotus pulmonarius]|nr:hypothetical protein EYR36_009891 [Pleurotus pulmonarius]